MLELKSVDEVVTERSVRPAHYKECSLECWESMLITFGHEKTIDWCLITVYKYVWRWKSKNKQEDLHKANWYLAKAEDLYNEMGLQPGTTFVELKHYVNRYLEKEE